MSHSESPGLALRLNMNFSCSHSKSFVYNIVLAHGDAVGMKQ